MADNNVDELVALLVEAFRKFKIALSQAEAQYQAAMQHGIFPDNNVDKFVASLENLRIARENYAKVGQQFISQADATGSSSSQPAPVEQDNVADASEERKSDASLQELERIMTAPDESVERNKAVLEGSVEHKAALKEPVEQNAAATEETLERSAAATEETVECDTASQEEEAAENDTINAPEEPVKCSTDAPQGEEGCSN